ncbi:hypothetical protein V6N13_010891 [Hibiscus sabdariffa]
MALGMIKGNGPIANFLGPILFICSPHLNASTYCNCPIFYRVAESWTQVSKSNVNGALSAELETVLDASFVLVSYKSMVMEQPMKHDDDADP